MSTTKFKNDMEVRKFDSPTLPKPHTTGGKFGEGSRTSKKVSNEASMNMTNKFHRPEGGNLK